MAPCPHSLPRVSSVCSGSPGPPLRHTQHLWCLGHLRRCLAGSDGGGCSPDLCSALRRPPAPSLLLSPSRRLLQTLTPHPQGARFWPCYPLGSLCGPRQLPCWGDREHSPRGQVPQAGSRAGSLGLCCSALCPFMATCPPRLVKTRMGRVEGWHRGRASEGEDRAGGLRGVHGGPGTMGWRGCARAGPATSGDIWGGWHECPVR